MNETLDLGALRDALSSLRESVADVEVRSILQKHVPEYEVWALVRALKALPNTIPT